MVKKENYTSKPGEVIKLITNQIKNDKHPKKAKHPRIEKLKSGTLKNLDLKYVMQGIELLEGLVDLGAERIMASFESSEEQKEIDTKVAIAKMVAKLAGRPIGQLLYEYRKNLYLTYNAKRDKASLDIMNEIVQSSRGGVVTKPIIRIEKDEDGNEKRIQSEIPISEHEVANIVSDYKQTLEEIPDNQFSNYISIGMNILRLLGAIRRQNC